MTGRGLGMRGSGGFVAVMVVVGCVGRLGLCWTRVQVCNWIRELAHHRLTEVPQGGLLLTTRNPCESPYEVSGRTRLHMFSTVRQPLCGALLLYLLSSGVDGPIGQHAVRRTIWQEPVDTPSRMSAEVTDQSFTLSLTATLLLHHDEISHLHQHHAAFRKQLSP